MQVGSGIRLAAGTLALAALAGCGESRAPSERPPAAAAVSVRLAMARIETTPVEVDAVGTVRARATTVITANLRAYVAEVRAREGTRVAAGDLLVRLDDADALAQVARAEGGLQAAGHTRDEALAALPEARAHEREAGAARAEAEAALEAQRQAVDEAAAAVAGAEAQATLAQTTLGRYRQMFEERALSPQEYEEMVARERTARAELERARARLEGARATLGQRGSRLVQTQSGVEATRARTQGLQSRVQGAEARIREAEAEVRRARVQVSYTRITAPGPGLVVERPVEVGELATPGVPLVRLDDPSGYRLEAQLVSSHAIKVRVGQEVAVHVDDLQEGRGDAWLPGRVAEIVPAADPATRTVTVKVDLPPAAGLRSGLYGKARFAVGQAETLRVPAAAVAERGQLTSVYVVDDQQVARLRLVATGPRAADRVEILSGLAPGERVVVDGVDRLTDGARVTVTP